MIVMDRWGRPVVLFRNEWKADSLVVDEVELDLRSYSLPPDE
mgnify:CR=1 FL=1|tara:strand:+ start:190 stop:315 length:126 start_codon:yes stop_codon:yes gene_type:complete